MKYALGIAAVAVFLIAATVPAFAQGAFADVPSDHWAYDAVQELAQAGIVIGYPDGLYKGQRQMTRYEFAMAIARLLDKGVKGAKGDTGATGPAGPAGAQGPKGDTGPAGTGGGEGLTDRQKQLLQQLEQEFMPELKQIRADVDDLLFRVEDLEAICGKEKTAKINLGGSISYRTGLYGSKLKWEGGKDTTGYPGFHGLAKDAFKTPHFNSMVTKLTVSGQLNDATMVYATLLAEPRTNRASEFTSDSASEWGAFDITDGETDSIGLMDMVRIDEAWAKVSTKFVVPISL